MQLDMISGGAILGKGAKGVTIDVHSDVEKDNDTLYHHVLNASSIALYSIGAKPFVYDDTKSIQDFANIFISKMLVAKSFSKEDDFEREVAVYEHTN